MGHVYLLKCDRRWEGQHLVKIGMTDRLNVYDRVREIQDDWETQRCLGVQKITSFHTTTAGQDETELHRKFKKFSVYGKDIQRKWGGNCSGDSEWFAVDNSQLQSIVNCYSHQSYYEPDRIPWLGIGVVVAIGFILGSLFLRPSAPTVTVRQLANVRSTPNGKVLCKVQKGDRLPIVDDSNTWIKVKACGTTGVIFKEMVQQNVN
jgi:Meiotically up-regulated gene 113